MVEKYSADALRFTLAVLAAQGRDIRLSNDRLVITSYSIHYTKLYEDMGIEPYLISGALVAVQAQRFVITSYSIHYTKLYEN